MIRPITMICAGVAAFAGLYLYHVKHQTQLLERTITRTQVSIDAARERSGVLRAEWTLMNDPDRLAELAGQFLKLVTVAPRQFTTIADLANRLPAPRALPVAPDQSTDAPATEAPADAETPDPVAEAPLPLPPPPAPPIPQRIAAPAQAPAPARPAVPSAQAASGGTAQSAFASAPPVARAPVVASPASPPPATVAVRPAAPVVVQRPTPPTPVAVAAPPTNLAGGGSALGMARGIVAPPVPIGGDIHLTRGN